MKATRIFSVCCPQLWTILMLLVLLQSACTIEKRHYMPGYHMSFKKSPPKHAASKENILSEMQPKTAVAELPKSMDTEAEKAPLSLMENENKLNAEEERLENETRETKYNEKPAQPDVSKLKKYYRKNQIKQTVKSGSVSMFALMSFIIGLFCMLYMVYFSVFIFVGSLIAEVLEVAFGIYTIEALILISVLPEILGIVFGVIGGSSGASDANNTFAGLGLAFSIIALLIIIIELALMILILSLI